VGEYVPERSDVGILVLVLVILLIAVAFFVPMFGIGMWGPMMSGGGMMGGWGYPYGTGWGFMFAGMLIPLLFIILVVVGAYFLLSPRTGSRVESEKAISILNERYAKGEISKEQYLEMKENLTKK
jgi:putative membrane protein